MCCFVYPDWMFTILILSPAFWIRVMLEIILFWSFIVAMKVVVNEVLVCFTYSIVEWMNFYLI